MEYFPPPSRTWVLSSGMGGRERVEVSCGGYSSLPEHFFFFKLPSRAVSLVLVFVVVVALSNWSIFA